MDQSPLIETTKGMNSYDSKLYKDETIDKQFYWFLHSSSPSLPTMYELPKVHKSYYPVRPIISSVGLYIYELAKHLADLINKNPTKKSFSYIEDSFEFVKMITELPAGKN
jgi:hypothetical protein